VTRDDDDNDDDHNNNNNTGFALGKTMTLPKQIQD
jgi:hypothetical protein